MRLTYHLISRDNLVHKERLELSTRRTWTSTMRVYQFRHMCILVPIGGIEPPTHEFSVRCSTIWAILALFGPHWWNRTTTPKFVASCNIHFTKRGLNLVEDSGIEPLTQACKASVFPIRLIPQFLKYTRRHFDSNCLVWDLMYFKNDWQFILLYAISQGEYLICK